MKTIYKIISDFCRDARGTATIEFVLIVPVILGVYGITFGTFHAYLQSSRAAKSMYVVSDIISRHHILTDEILVQSHQVLDALYFGNLDHYSMRVSRVTYISDDDAADDPDFDPTDFYQVDDGYYGVDWSRSMPHEDPSAPNVTDGGSFELLESADLENYELPTLGSGAHAVLVNVSAPYHSPLEGNGLFGIGRFFDDLSWDYDTFVWPRDPRGIFLEDGSGDLLPIS